MRLNYLIQPEIQVGSIVANLMTTEPPPNCVILVSAFANRQTLLRYKASIKELLRSGARIRIVLGIDLGGTTKEALEEVNSWGADVRIVKHRSGDHTFHPKIFIFERPRRVDVVIGSNNITEGGFFKNYEGGVQITYELPQDQTSYDEARLRLSRFLDPMGATCQQLSAELLALLLRRRDIPTEAEVRRVRRFRVAISQKANGNREGSPFGVDDIPSPPPLPREVIEALIPVVETERKHEKRLRKGTGRKVAIKSSVEIDPTSFYMTLPAMRGNIPGEPRIPFSARDLASFFWGWPEKYKFTQGPRGGNRRYWNWKPVWRIYDSENPDQVFHETIRMYEYEESSDFRFYSGRLLALGADKGDIVRITRISDQDAEFECVLARRETQAYDQWQRYCTELVRNSNRRWGYA